MAHPTLEAKIQALRDLPTPDVRQHLRVVAGVTQDDIARELGVHRETVSRWERGERMPRGRLLVEYVAVLRMLRSEVGPEVQPPEGLAVREVPCNSGVKRLLKAIAEDKPEGPSEEALAARAQALAYRAEQGRCTYPNCPCPVPCSDDALVKR